MLNITSLDNRPTTLTFFLGRFVEEAWLIRQGFVDSFNCAGDRSILKQTTLIMQGRAESYVCAHDVRCGFNTLNSPNLV
jgi:hypothetical protein